MGFLGGAVVKEFACNAGGTRDEGSIPKSRRFPIVGDGNSLQYCSWRIPWTEEPGGQQSMGLQRVGHDRATEHNTHTRVFLGMKLLT